jgi:uncharacterized membrane protein YebE (DUF533 family)
LQLRLARFALLFSILAALTVSTSGCLWLAIPSLAYQGYQATEGKKASTKSTQKSHKSQTKSAQPQAQENYDDVE